MHSPDFVRSAAGRAHPRAAPRRRRETRTWSIRSIPCLVLALAAARLPGQSPSSAFFWHSYTEPLGDIDRTPTGTFNGASAAEPVANQGVHTVFTAHVPGLGWEIGRTDRQTGPGTTMFDLNPGPRGSYPLAMGQAPDGGLLFNAIDDARGREPWYLPAAGVPYQVRDVSTGPLGSTFSGAVDLGGSLFFTSYHTAPGGGVTHELMKFTPLGAGIVTSIATLPIPADKDLTRSVTLFGDGQQQLFAFVDLGPGGVQLYGSDGSGPGTTLLHTFPEQTRPIEGALVGGRLCFSISVPGFGQELWRTDGTALGTNVLVDIQPGATGSSPSDFAQDGLAFCFAADDGVNGRELWRSDGTQGGTAMVKDIRPGSLGSNPEGSRSLSNRFLFSANDGVSGREPHVSDGTAAGTNLIKDVNPGIADSTPTRFTGAGGGVFFSAFETGTGFELHFTDLTAAGTRVIDVRPGTASSHPYGILGTGSGVVFGANDGVLGEELWISNGTAAGTRNVHDLSPTVPRNAGSNMDWGAAAAPSQSPFAGLRRFGAGSDGTSGTELYETDGTPQGTGLVADINPGTASSSPAVLGYLGDGVALLAATDAANGRELWRSDGTAAGTTLVMDINPGGNSDPDAGVTAADYILFRASNGSSGAEPWRSDGTAAGTWQVADINPSGGSDPDAFVDARDYLMWAANDGTSGREPYAYRSGPLPRGSVARIKDINPGPGSSNPRSPVVVGGVVLFIANDGTRGDELWRTDGTEAGTVLVKDINPGPGSGFVPAARLALFRGRAYFAANDGAAGAELWTSDGTTAETRLLIDLATGPVPSNPRELTATSERLFFVATTPPVSLQPELFVSDGTAAGTARVPLPPFTAVQGGLFAVGRRVYFASSANVLPPRGIELWVSDGTADGTFQVDDLAPGERGSAPQGFALAGGSLVFSADGGPTGREPWRRTRPGAHAQRIGRPCGPSFPELSASPPVIGGTATLSAEGAPVGQLALVLMSAAPSSFLPIGGGCHLSVDLLTLWVAESFVTTGPMFSRPVPIPDLRELLGLPPLAAQVVFAELAPPYALVATNGVLLVLDLE